MPIKLANEKQARISHFMSLRAEKLGRLRKRDGRPASGRTSSISRVVRYSHELAWKVAVSNPWVSVQSVVRASDCMSRLEVRKCEDEVLQDKPS